MKETATSLEFIHFKGVEVPSRAPRPVKKAAGRPLAGLSSITHRNAPQPPGNGNPFVAWLLERGGISPNIYRPTPLKRRIPSLLRLLRVDSTTEARRVLESRPDLVPAALNALLIGVSSFFRDPEVFTTLESSVLPALLSSGNDLTVFSAGSSDGHEVYSLAMLLAERNALHRSTLLGVDCRPDAVARARAGRFPEGDLEEMGSPWRERYFFPEHGTWRARTHLRMATQWQCADLVAFSPPVCDLILFRNVAIYLEEQPAAIIWQRLCSALKPGGFLVTGSAEKPSPSMGLRCICKSVFQK